MNIEVHQTPKPKTLFRWHIVGGLCLLNNYRKGAELGVSTGRFTMFLCGAMHDMEMTCVDLWNEQPNNTGEGAETFVGWDHDGHYQTFKQVCADYFDGRVTIHRMDTVAAAGLVEDGSLDFIFIDADHTYEGCKRDIEAWTPKVRTGGMICGHDYNPKWPGVIRAVNESGMKFAVMPDSVWAHFKR